MSVTADILRSWHSPRLVLRARLSQGVREDRALAVLLCACLMMFIAQWPGLARAAQGAPDVPLQARLGGALLATMFLLPLVFYVLAGLSQIVLRVFVGPVSAFSARFALFWSLLALSPAVLMQGLYVGLIGPGQGSFISGLLVLLAFALLWMAALREVVAQRSRADLTTHTTTP